MQYKFLNGLRGSVSNYQYTAINEWQPIIDPYPFPLQLCVKGYHTCKKESLIHWCGYGDTLYYVCTTPDGVGPDEEGQYAWRSIILMSKIESWNASVARRLAAAIAHEALEILQENGINDDYLNETLSILENDVHDPKVGKSLLYFRLGEVHKIFRSNRHKIGSLTKQLLLEHVSNALANATLLNEYNAAANAANSMANYHAKIASEDGYVRNREKYFARMNVYNTWLLRMLPEVQ